MAAGKEMIGEFITKIPVDDIYQKGLQPAVTELGIGLGKAVKLALAPITALAWGYEKIAEYLESAIPAYFESRNISKEKIISPDVAIAIPAIEAMRYTRDDVRSKLVNLLAASMNTDTAEFVHPAFVEILKQMTPDEAKILNQLPKEFLHEPIIDIAVEKYHQNGLFVLFNSIGLIGEDANCEFPDRLPLYLTNLTRLGLVDIPENSGLADAWRYNRIRKSSLYLDKVKAAEKEGKVIIMEKMVGITVLGADLRRAST